MISTINDIVITPLTIIDNPKGNIYHGMKNSDRGCVGFGEAYFSELSTGQIKGWNRHKHMTLNLIVPVGSVKFVIVDNKIIDNKNYLEVELSLQNYKRLTVPSGLWVGFQNIAEQKSMILNIADIEHDPTEKETISLDEIDYVWNKV